MTPQRDTATTGIEREAQRYSQSTEHPLAEAGQEVGDTAGRMAERAADVGFKRADHAKERAADGLQQVTQSIRRVSNDMQTEQPAIANIATTAADGAERVAEYLRTTDARQILGTVEDMARRQPLLFLGGAFVLGVAASRFIKAAGGPSGQQSWQSGHGGQQSGSRSKGGRSGYGQQRRSGGTYTGEFQATGPGGSLGTDTGLELGTNGKQTSGRRGEGV